MPAETSVFISYRRDDAAGHAGRLFDHLSARLGDGRVFMDVDSIEPGSDFAEVIATALDKCQAAIVIIGPRWASERLSQADDLVRIEVETAMSRRLPVIPVLVHGAEMPVAADLPPSLRPLTRLHAFELTEHHWGADVSKLVAVLAGRLAGAGQADPIEHPVDRTEPPVGNILPAPMDAFVGREGESQEVKTALTRNRLVTLIGPGGCGKTRLALEVVASRLPSFPDGVWFVALASASTGDRVVPLVASSLTLAERADEPIITTLENWLRDRRALLVLDNCEHVVPAVTALAERLLRACPDVRVLATSRERIGVRGERALVVAPLAVPDDPVFAVRSDAVELFLTRAAAFAPGFDAQRADRSVVAEICRRLDGLPLAIELAAARLRALSLDQLAARLDDRFRLLGGRGRTEEPRQRTLAAVVDWSYDLLSDEERHLFCRLAVFVDQFDLEAAELVTVGEPVEEGDVLDLLTRLVEKSLVSTDTSGTVYRFRLLETLRQYALSRLVELDELDRMRDRLLAWAITRVDHVEAALRRPGQDVAIRSVTLDRASLRAAMEWAMERGERLLALRIASAIPIGLNSERRAVITTLLSSLGDGIDHLTAGRAWSAVGNMAFEQSDWRASSEANARAREHFRLGGSERHAAWAAYLGFHAAWGAGDHEAADSLLPEALEYFRREADPMGLGYSLWVASLRTEDLVEAKTMSAEADALLREADVPMGVAHNTEGRGIIALERGELDDAAHFVSEAVELFSSYGNLGCTAHAVEAAAVVVAAVGKPEAATELLAAAEELRDRSGQGHRPWEVRARHGPIEDRIPVGAALTAARASGRGHTLQSAAAFAQDVLRVARRSPATAAP